MGDVYVEVGDVKGKVDNKYLSNAQAGMKAAVTEAVNKAKSGMTLVKPGGGKGIRVSVVVKTLAQDGNNVSCSLIGVLQELPGKEPFTPSASAAGEGKVAGKIDAVAGDCVKKAVADMMGKVGPSIATSQAAPASTSTAASKSPLVFIAPFQVGYPSNTTAAPAGLAAGAKTAITTMMDRKIRANTARFTQNSAQFKAGSGMPAYAITINVESLVFDASARELRAKAKGFVAEHPSGSIRVPTITGGAKIPDITRPPRDPDQIQLLADAAEQAMDTAINWILTTHP